MGSRKLRYAIFAHFCLICTGILFVYPLLWMISTSLKKETQIFQRPTEWIPDPFQLINYKHALTVIPYFDYVFNTFEIVFWVMIGSMLVNPAIAYAFAKLSWKGRNALFVIVLSTMILPYQVTMIPLYSTFVKLGWINTILPLVVPAFFGNPFLIFLLRQFFLTLPEELSEASRVDGASEFRIYWNIVLPLCRPALVTVALFSFIWVWTDFLGPLIYLTDKVHWTISIGLMQFLTTHGLQWSLLMAGSAVFMLPVIILFLFMQRVFIQGITMTGLK